MADDILDTTVPEHVPGALFKAIADDLYDRYPISRRKAEVAALAVIDITIRYYEAVAADEGIS